MRDPGKLTPELLRKAIAKLNDRERVLLREYVISPGETRDFLVSLGVSEVTADIFGKHATTVYGAVVREDAIVPSGTCVLAYEDGTAVPYRWRE